MYRRYFHIIGDPQVKLWGITPRERLLRQIRQVADISPIDDLSALPHDASVLLLRGEYVMEVRILRRLLGHPGTLLRCASDQRLAAAFVSAAHAVAADALLRGDLATVPEGLTVVDPVGLESFDMELSRSAQPLLAPVSPSERQRLEDLLYGSAYKGITDLVTKWFWPRPAKRAVRWLADRRATPNMVTSVGMLLMLLAGLLFYQGHYALGLAVGWVMTFLDTVDGKLARVTAQSSRLGHFFDHGIDLLHPPFWYILWGMSLTEFDTMLGLDQTEYYWMIVIGYVGGRLCEGLFGLLGSCSIFGWRPFDAYFRLFTARRNTCMLLLTSAVAVGRPDWGLVAVALWTAFTTTVLTARLLHGAFARATSGPLRSWLSDPEQAERDHPRAFHQFSVTQRAYARG
ncbi:MAG: CDP-alcohol phosphatidyltransferase family protein [Sedimenticolaceae bacterium]